MEMSDAVELAKENVDNHPLSGLGVVLCGIAHYLAWILFVNSLVFGILSTPTVWALLVIWTYLVIASVLVWYGDGQRPGETGARYIARMALSPYTKPFHLSIGIAQAVPKVIGSVIDWLVTPKDVEE